MNTKTITAILLITLFTGAAAAQSTTNIQPIRIGTDPFPAQSGEDADINFKLRNDGDTTTKNVEVQLLDSFPFQIKPDQKRNYSLGNMVSGQEYQISTEVLVAENAPDGRSNLKIRISHGEFSTVKNLPVEIQNQEIELNLANLKTTPPQLTPDTEDAKIQLELVNNGEKTAENVVMNIELSENFQETSSFSTRQALGNLAAGETKTAEYTFDIKETAENGTVTIPAEISYSTGDSSSRITENTDFSFYLAGRPQYEVVNTESNLKTGSSGEVRITVRNTGNEKSSSTRIRVLDSANLPFSYSSSSQYIGTLQPGQEGTAVFDVTTENGADAKKYLLDFEIRGVKDTSAFVEDTTIPLEVENGENSSSLPLPLIMLVAVVLAAVGYFKQDRLKSLF